MAGEPAGILFRKRHNRVAKLLSLFQSATIPNAPRRASNVQITFEAERCTCMRHCRENWAWEIEGLVLRISEFRGIACAY